MYYFSIALKLIKPQMQLERLISFVFIIVFDATCFFFLPFFTSLMTNKSSTKHRRPLGGAALLRHSQEISNENNRI